MNKLAALCLFGVLALVNAGAVNAGDTPADAKKAVLALEDTWAQSQRTNNPDLISAHWADTIVSTSADGKTLDKAGMIASAKSAKYDSVEYTNMKATAYGNTVVVTGGFKGTGTSSEGKPFTPEQWTDTWVMMPDGKWQCVATHSSTLGM